MVTRPSSLLRKDLRRLTNRLDRLEDAERERGEAAASRRSDGDAAQARLGAQSPSAGGHRAAAGVAQRGAHRRARAPRRGRCTGAHGSIRARRSSSGCCRTPYTTCCSARFHRSSSSTTGIPSSRICRFRWSFGPDAVGCRVGIHGRRHRAPGDSSGGAEKISRAAAAASSRRCSARRSSNAPTRCRSRPTAAA